MPERLTGKVAKWIDSKGCGFITPDDGGKDYWVQEKEVMMEGRYTSLTVGEEVEFSLKPAPEPGQEQAAEVTPVGGGKFPAKEPPGGGRGRSDSRRPPPRRRDDSRDKGRGKGGGKRDKPHEPNKLFIGRLHDDVTENDIRDKFESVGKIKSVAIITDKDTGKPKGFGFIEFEEDKDAEKALEEMKDVEICGQAIRLDTSGKRGPGKGGGGGRDRSRSGPRGKGGGKTDEPNKLFIGRLSFDAQEDDIKDAFRDVGEVVSVKIVKDGDGKSKGFGFIEFARIADADEAMHKMNGTEICGAACRLEPAGKPVGGGKGKGGRGRSDSRSRSRSPPRRRPPPRRSPPPKGRGRSRSRSPPPKGRGRKGDSRSPKGRGRGPPPNGPRDRGGYRDDYDDRGRGPPPRRDGGGKGRRRGPDDRDDSRRPPPRDGPPPRRRGDPGSRSASSGSRPAGVPKKSKAMQEARRSFEQSEADLKGARAELAAAKAALDKMEKVSEQAIKQKISKTEKAAKRALEEGIVRMKKEAKNTLTEALEDAEKQLQEELQQKLADAKKEFGIKVRETHLRIKQEHEETQIDAEKELQKDCDDKIAEARKQAEEEEEINEWRDAHRKAAQHAEDEESRLIAAKKKLESLTGQQVRSHELEKGGGDDGRGDGVARDRMPKERGDRGGKRDRGGGGKGGGKRGEIEDDYSYYSDEDGAPPPAPGGRGGRR